MRGATLRNLSDNTVVRISIHAPHARSDKDFPECIHILVNFNPRSSCEERHSDNKDADCDRFRFQSTLLMRGATNHGNKTKYLAKNFNPRSSCEERHGILRQIRVQCISIHAPHARSDGQSVEIATGTDISIHAPHARSDAVVSRRCSAVQFQSTLLMRGATVSTIIQIRRFSHFNPRSSCEERRSPQSRVRLP